MALHSGDQIRLPAEYKDADGAYIDLPVVKCTVKIPNSAGGTQTVYTYGTDSELVRTDTGKYYLLYSIENTGEHSYSFEAFTLLGESLVYEDKSFTSKVRKIN